MNVAATDLVVCNGRVITLDRSARICEAMVVRDGQVVCVGSNEEASALADSDTRVLDAGGRADRIDRHRFCPAFALAADGPVDGDAKQP